MPELPKDSPDSLLPIVELINNKLGIDDLKIFDLREDTGGAENGNGYLSKIMIVGSGKSEKHLQKATVELMNFIKHDLNFQKIPDVEGFVKNNKMVKKQKKLRKKAKQNSSYHNNDYGVLPNSWIMVDAKIDDISIHFMTPRRRKELNLEMLWCRPEDQHLYEAEAGESSMNDDIFSGIRHYHTLRLQPRFGLSDFSHFSSFSNLSSLSNHGKRYYSSATTVILPQINSESNYLISNGKEIENLENLTKILKEVSAKGDYLKASEIAKIYKFNLHGLNDLSTLVLTSYINHLKKLSVGEAQSLLKEGDFYKNFNLFFPLTGPTDEHFKLRHEMLLLLHKILPKKFDIVLIRDNLLTKISTGYLKADTNDLISYCKVLIESPSFDNFKEDDIESISSAKFNKFAEILDFVKLSDDQLLIEWDLKIVPYLLILGSNFNSSEFIRPRYVLDNLNNFNEKFSIFGTSVKYSKKIDTIYRLLKFKKFQFLKDNESKVSLLILLTIYGNARKFDVFYKILREVYQDDISTKDIVTDVFEKPDNRPWDFVISYIYKSNDKKEYMRFINDIYPEIKLYNEFSDVFNSYLKLMVEEVERHDN
ncbi:hypothetical protein PACTADRAFT_34900 [Pachysolen tannophilus NRRL Y-2460]|uniref:ATPase synthesis protein 25 n=1 Tax=Pachysolen tannophilus NRRL Y-2460 TaxID=669874 RepID=A0A1E4TQT8_PACTA|nr:hypothetical protein PACTADRAFT_34900 [Pachysolen tannophilus NRRL Y-2460]